LSEVPRVRVRLVEWTLGQLTMNRLEQRVVDDAIDHNDQWQRRLLACVDAAGGHFEHNLGL